MSNEVEWQPARLIPTSGINGQDEAERRATSALLAVTGVVKEFGFGLLRPLGAPSGALETFIEVPFVVGERRVYPDGLIRARRGAKSWTALVEVKTGSAALEAAQLETYLDVAREQGFDAVLTISNEIPHAPGVHPTTVDRRRLKKVSLHHYSWAEVLTLAVQHRVHRGVSDPEQAWILGELIRYLEHPKSGALDFSDMGENWTSVRDAVAAGTLRRNDKGLTEVVVRWEQLLRYTALRMGRELGADVQVLLNRKQQADPALRVAEQVTQLVDAGRLTGVLRVPQAIGDITLTADLRAGRMHVSVAVEAPDEGRPLTRVNWLLRQLRGAPPQLRLESWSHMSRHSMSELHSAVAERPELLVEDPKKDLRSFRITATSALGAKRGVGRGGFIDSVLSAVNGFYETVVQDLRGWVPKAPQLPSGGRTAVSSAGIDISPPAVDLQEESNDTEAVPSDAPPDPASPEGLIGGATDSDEMVPASWSPPAPHERADGPLMEWTSVSDREVEATSAEPASDIVND